MLHMILSSQSVISRLNVLIYLKLERDILKKNPYNYSLFRSVSRERVFDFLREIGVFCTI